MATCRFSSFVFALPGRLDPGNGPHAFPRGPGATTGDLTMFKNIPLPGEGRRLQVRAEAYNVLNKTQRSAMDTTARFDPGGVRP
jgi:outer membrane receptor protein involved in Fe transport